MFIAHSHNVFALTVIFSTVFICTADDARHVLHIGLFFFVTYLMSLPPFTSYSARSFSEYSRDPVWEAPGANVSCKCQCWIT